MGLVGPEHPSVAENRLGVDRIASEGASDDHIIGAISFRRLHLLLRPFVFTSTNHVYICCNYLFARQFILDISSAVSVLRMFWCFILQAEACIIQDIRVYLVLA